VSDSVAGSAPYLFLFAYLDPATLPVAPHCAVVSLCQVTVRRRDAEPGCRMTSGSWSTAIRNFQTPLPRNPAFNERDLPGDHQTFWCGNGHKPFRL
jgi:hypothetical protein